MLVRCPRCSVSLDLEPNRASGAPVAACKNCGYTGAPFGGGASLDPGPRAPLSTFAGARAKLATATQDLFRLSGANSIPASGGNSIPVEASFSEPAPAAKVPEEPARTSEASIMFSLEELMKGAPASAQSKREEPSDQLWNMQASTPLFGTAYDQALLTTPLKQELTSMESMTVPSQQPAVRRWLPLVVAIVGGSTALAGVGWWAFAPESPEIRPSEAVAAIAPAQALPAPSEAPAEAAAQPALAEAAAVPPPVPEAAPQGAAGAPAEAAPAEAAAPTAENAPAPAEAKDEKAKPSSRKRPPAKAASPSSAAFNTNAARSSLESAAAKAAGCKGGSGKGKVQLTFATSGRVSSAQLVSGPFAGTPAGNCALRHFKAARVPAFSGSPQTVAKSFKIP